MTEYLELLGVVEAIAAGDMTRESMIEMAREALGEIEPGGGLIPHDPLDDEPDDEEPDEEDRPTPSDDEPDICAVCGMNRAGGRVCKCMHPDEREEVDSLTCAACADPRNGALCRGLYGRGCRGCRLSGGSGHGGLRKLRAAGERGGNLRVVRGFSLHGMRRRDSAEDRRCRP